MKELYLAPRDLLIFPRMKYILNTNATDEKITHMHDQCHTKSNESLNTRFAISPKNKVPLHADCGKVDK